MCMRLVVSVGGSGVGGGDGVSGGVGGVGGWMADGGVRDNSHRRAIVTYKYYKYYIACTSLQYLSMQTLTTMNK